MTCRYLAFILFFSAVVLCRGLEDPKTEKIENLKQKIGLKTTAALDNFAYNILVEKLDSLGIKDEQLKDGFDWGGRQAGFETYINNNIDTLLSFFVKVEDIVVDKNESMKQKDSIKVNSEVEMPQIIQAVDNLSIKKSNLNKINSKDKSQKIKNSKSRKSLFSRLRIGSGLGKAIIKGSTLSRYTSQVESSLNIRFPFGLKVGPFLTSIGYETSKYAFTSSVDTLDSYYGIGRGVIINVDLSKIIKIGGENLVKEFVVGSQNYDHGSGLMAGYNVNLLLGSLPCSISMSSRFNTLKFNNGGTSYWGSLYVGMGIDFL
jgi:hypothetical protein